MNVSLPPLQSGINNYSAYQLVVKPIILVVAGVALATLAVFLTSTYFKRMRNRVHHQFSQIPNVNNTVRLSHPPSVGAHRVTIRREDLKSDPYRQLFELAKSIRTHGLEMKTYIVFQDKNGKNEEARDLGGPSRQFFTELFSSLKGLFAAGKTQSKDFHCHSNKRSTFLVPQGEPTREPNSSIFQAIGMVMMYVYFHPTSRVIGPIFHEAIFSAILSLDDHEIDAPYHQLSDTAKFKMCRALIYAQQASGEDLAAYLAVVDLLEKGGNTTDEEINHPNVKIFCNEADSKGGSFKEFFLDEEDSLGYFLFDMKAIKSNKKRFLTTCLTTFLEYIFKKQEASLGTVGLTLFPIHTIAKGMKSVANKQQWMQMRVDGTPFVSTSSATIMDQIEAAKTLQRRIQGTLDRSLLANMISLPVTKITNPETGDISEIEETEAVKQQAAWLRAWILNGASDSQVEEVCFFLTGSSSIDPGKIEGLIVQGREDCLLPVANTCENRIFVRCDYYPNESSLFHNRTYEGFCQMLIEAMKEKGFNRE